MTAPEPVYPDDYRKCSACGAPLGERCRTVTGAIIHGRPYPQIDPVISELDHPHTVRELRTGAVSR